MFKVEMSLKKSTYALAPITLVPLAPVVGGVNYPIILLTVLSLCAVLLMIKEEPSGSYPCLKTTIITSLYVSAVALLASWLWQPAVTLNGGLGWDGINYGHLYEKFVAGSSTLPLVAPFHQRIGMPFLASRLPLDPRLSFYLLHSLFWLGAMALLALTCRKGLQIPHSLTILGIVWLQIHWVSTPRATASYTFMVDSASIFFTMALTYGFVTRQRATLFIMLAFVGTFFKETVLLWCLCLSFGAFFMADKKEKKAAWLALAIAIVVSKAVSVYCNEVVPVATNPGPWTTIENWIRIRALQPFEYLRYLAATFNATGGLLSIFIFTAMKFFKDRDRDNTLLTLMAAAGAYLGLCFFAGTDLTKFALMSFPLSFPLVLALAAKYIAAARYRSIVLLVALTLPVTHFLELIPSPFKGRELPNLDANGPYSWMMEYAHPFLVAAWLAYFLAVLLLTFRLYNRNRLCHLSA